MKTFIDPYPKNNRLLELKKQFDEVFLYNIALQHKNKELMNEVGRLRNIIEELKGNLIKNNQYE